VPDAGRSGNHYAMLYTLTPRVNPLDIVRCRVRDSLCS
jgi:hypothetical protein